MELTEIRANIDRIDAELLRLFLERMELADRTAEYKAAHNLPILNREREREILAKVTEDAGDRERYAYHLFATLLELSRSRQAELVSPPAKVTAYIEAALAGGGDHVAKSADLAKFLWVDLLASLLLDPHDEIDGVD